MAKYRVMLVYVKAGGGHVSIANAIKDALNEWFPGDFECVLVDAFAEDSFLRAIFEEGYRITSNYLLPVYAFVYYFSRLGPINEFEFRTIEKRIYKYLLRQIEEHKPNIVIIVHPMVIRAVRRAVKESSIKPLELLTILDLISPPQWFYDKTLPATVSTEYLYNYAITKYKYPKENLRIVPAVLRKQFFHKLSKEEVRELKGKFGFDPDKRLVLIAAGGDGLPGGENVVKELLKQKIDTNIAVVCGRNELQKSLVMKMIELYRADPKFIKVYGFVDFMYELMNMADVIISKAGFSMTFEILTLEKPLIISNYIWGQERGNVKFVVDNKVGFFIKNPRKIVQKINEIFSNPSVYEEILQNIRKLGLRNGSKEMAEFIKNYIESGRI